MLYPHAGHKFGTLFGSPRLRGKYGANGMAARDGRMGDFVCPTHYDYERGITTYPVSKAVLHYTCKFAGDFIEGRGKGRLNYTWSSPGYEDVTFEQVIEGTGITNLVEAELTVPRPRVPDNGSAWTMRRGFYKSKVELFIDPRCESYENTFPYDTTYALIAPWIAVRVDPNSTTTTALDGQWSGAQCTWDFTTYLGVRPYGTTSEWTLDELMFEATFTMERITGSA